MSTAVDALVLLLVLLRPSCFCRCSISLFYEYQFLPF